MKRALGVLFIAVVSMTMLAASGMGGRNSTRDFLGLWEGVDVNDGSKRSISITDHDGDGVVKVAARDTYWTLCQGDRGLETAMGRVDRDGMLKTDGTVVCFDAFGNVESEADVKQVYKLSRRERTLVAAAITTTLIPITLHLVSE